uniref:Outer dense fiber of sperm tails 3B n=1 Tax=Anas platyrhynchos platyrhynchos TaxID=8840 RepID=A0A493T324_ANAPP
MLGPRIVSKSSAPNYSMPGRSTVGAFYQDLCKTPGPCNYRVVDANVYKSRAPQYSMLARNELPGDTTLKPGPGAYSPSTVRTRRGRQGGHGGQPPALALTLTLTASPPGQAAGADVRDPALRLPGPAHRGRARLGGARGGSASDGKRSVPKDSAARLVFQCVNGMGAVPTPSGLGLWEGWGARGGGGGKGGWGGRAGGGGRGGGSPAPHPCGSHMWIPRSTAMPRPGCSNPSHSLPILSHPHPHPTPSHPIPVP